MNGWMTLAFSGVAGILLGAFFFGGLWWTVKKGLSSKSPMALFFASIVTRSAVVLAGFYFVSRWQPGRLFACLAGFFIAHAAAKFIAFPAAGDGAPAGKFHGEGLSPAKAPDGEKGLK